MSATTGQALVGGATNFTANMTYLANGAAANGGATNPLTTEATLMWVDNHMSVIDGNGLRSDGHGKGTGLWGVNDNGTEGSGVNAFAALGTGVDAQGGLGAVQLVASGAAPATRPAPFIGKLGTLETDTGGNLSFCIGPSSPTTLQGVGSRSPAPLRPVHSIRSRRRASTTAEGTWAQRPRGPLLRRRAGSSRSGIARNLNGTVATPGVVPPGATAIPFNLTVTGTTGAFGYLSMVPGEPPRPRRPPSTGTDPGKTLANGGTVNFDANRQVKVFCSDPAAVSSTEFILDITGYYL